ncbi:MAG: KilA-N domain-containing protein [Patescibacteria group bacterium]
MKKIKTPSQSLSMVVKESQINVMKVGGEDYICLTDMAKSAGSERALHSWLRTKNTIDFLGFWEKLNNPNFKVHEFVYFKNNAGANSFNPSISEWIEKTDAVGILTRRGRYEGNYYSFSVTHSYRFVFEFLDKNNVFLINIGTHQIYKE